MKSPGSGFAGIAFEGDGLALYWKGELTSGMRGVVETARVEGRPVVVRAAPHSHSELQAAAAKIDKASKARGGSDLQSVEMRYDGAGLDIERMPSSAAATTATALGQSRLTSIEEILSDIDVDVPVSLATASAPYQHRSRVNDSSPWNGGGRWESWRGNDRRANCTLGFGVRASGRTWMLSAAHCGSIPDIAYQGVFGGGSGTAFKQMGPINSDQWAYDMLLIDAPGYHRMFDGSPTTNNYKNVHGWGYHAANELLCQSGMTSGVICGLRTGSSGNYSVSCQHPDSDGDCGYTIYGLISAVQIDGGVAGRSGDSGGPIFSLMGSGVRAKGVLSGGVGNSRITFQDWGDAIQLFGAYPVVI